VHPHSAACPKGPRRRTCGMRLSAPLTSTAVATWPPRSDEEKTGDFSYAAVMLYSPPPGVLFGDYDDFQTSVEFGVAEPNHQAIMTEVATLPDGADSPLAGGGAAATPETSVVALAVYDQVCTCFVYCFETRASPRSLTDSCI